MAIESFVAALPKVELHVHLVGSASVPTVLELAARHPNGPVPTTEAELAAFYRFRDFAHFAEVYMAVSSLIRDQEDLASLVLGVARDLSAQNARYVELTVTPYTHVLSGIPMRAVTEALDVSAREARRRHGIEIAYIFDIAAEQGVEGVKGTLEHALDHPPERLVGFGLAGSEHRRASYMDAIRDAFRAATAAGLHSVPHAGEMTGPEIIWEAVERLGAERIGHGISAVRDPRLVARLREAAIPLEVCPTSNVRTGQVAALEEHPLPVMLAEGLTVTVNSDDPPMFGTTLTREYLTLAHVFGLGPAEIAGVARNAVRASFMPEADKAALLAEIDALVAGSR
ncbi:MAG: adenosine deaminase [Actinomycetes bacterium]|jgi:aminodeoxyfutalosine deaminase|nr:MAG: adenosine deaminase [Actinomycetota bacterium]